jgi:hypothetical protein
LIVDGGKTIYIFPRKFMTEKNQMAWLEMSGIQVVKDEA